jgi:malonyl-CoA/methylmalonyl-CoA synthetase
MTSLTTSDAHTRFPNDPCFSQLLKIAEQKISSVIVNDPTSGVKADYNRLLHDISAFRRTFCKVLPSYLLQNGSLLQGDPIYVCTLLGPNYDFVIALLSILAIGGAVVPLCKLPFTILIIDNGSRN